MKPVQASLICQNEDLKSRFAILSVLTLSALLSLKISRRLGVKNRRLGVRNKNLNQVVD